MPVMKSSAATIDQYLRSLPDDRRAVLSKLRALIKRRIPKGYEESLLWGAIAYSVPLERFPDTYNSQPLGYVVLAARKNYFTLHLMPVYMNPEGQKALAEGFRKAGKKLDMGKACIRFKSLDDLPLDVIGDLVAKIAPEAWIAIYQKNRAGSAKKK